MERQSVTVNLPGWPIVRGCGRAIGTVMALNPLPLIIPCHRVIRADGSLGYFSAAGGVDTKQKMLNLENS